MVATAPRTCSLERSAGLDGTCPESIACAFWQEGATDLDGDCAIERLGLHRLGPDVAEFLLSRRAVDPLRPAALDSLPRLPGF